MRTRNIAFATLVLATCFVASAQTVDDLKSQLATLDQQILTLRQQLHQSPEWQLLQKAASDADKAYEDAVASDPAVSDMNRQLADLRQQMQAIAGKRVDRERQLAATTLAAQKAAKDQAEQKLLATQTSGDLGLAMQQRDQLVAALNAAQAAQQTK
jgi:predicted  nucleic acid-binding Zn-ribbon protein